MKNSSELLDRLLKVYEVKKEDVASVVELYYDAQKLRIAHANKQESEGPNDLVNWVAEWLQLGEKVITKKLDQWVNRASPEECKWAYSQVGIGPIIASGLAAHIDVEKANSISAVWKYAGLAPGYDRRIRGHSLDYNPKLKVLVWKLGESFVKVSANQKAYYGKRYVEFREIENKKNDEGKLVEAAKRELTTKKITDKKTLTILESGKLTDGHIYARSKRKTVKLFLSHYWTIGRQSKGLPIRQPYAIQVLGHDGYIAPPPLSFELKLGK